MYVVVRWQQDKNGKEAREETKGKSGRVYQGRQKMKRKYIIGKGKTEGKKASL